MHLQLLPDLPLMLRNPTRRFKLAIAIRYITVAINRTAGGNQGGTGSQVHPSILQYPRSQARNNKNAGEIYLDSPAHCRVIRTIAYARRFDPV